MYFSQHHYTLTDLSQVPISPTQRKLHVGKSRRVRRRTASPEGPRANPESGSPGRRKALCCSSGPAEPRAGISSPGLPTGREAIPVHPGSALSSRTQDLTLKALEIPTSQRTGSHGCSGTGLDVPVFSGLTALPAPNSPRLHGRLWEPAFPIHSLPHVIRIPPGELANILIHIL